MTLLLPVTARPYISPRRPMKPLQYDNLQAFINPNLQRIELFVRQSTRSLEFWRRALSIWASFKFTQATIAAQQHFRSQTWPRRAWDAQHEKAGKMMLKLCLDMKGFYVKAGQLIALQAFVPKIIREKLSVLQDNMPPMDAEEAEWMIQHELQGLGQSIQVFESLDLHNVLGSASIAQVHRGVLREGKREVAVKVQFPNMERLMMSDLANFRVLGGILEKTELNFDLTRPIEELYRQIAMEFDFEAEARGMSEIRYALRKIKSVSVPEAIPGLVSRRLLVMSYLHGTPMTKLHETMGRRSKRTIRFVGRKIMKNLTECYGKMILTDGFFQADCHPGNILVRNSNVDIGLLDFGQTKRFTNERRMNFVALVDAMARKDTDAIAKGLEDLEIRVVPNGKKKKRAKRTKHHLTLEEKLAYTMFDTASVPGVSDNPFAEDSALNEGSVTDLPKDLFFLLRTIQILKGLCSSTFNSDYSVISSWSGIARAELRRSYLRRFWERTPRERENSLTGIFAKTDENENEI